MALLARVVREESENNHPRQRSGDHRLDRRGRAPIFGWQAIHVLQKSPVLRNDALLW